MKVYKYVLKNLSNVFKVNENAQILHVASQGGEICMWATHSDDSTLIDREFFVVGTGHEFELVGSAHIGTVLIDSEAIVFHVFEKFKQ